MNPVQQQLLVTGSHFEPTGADAAGPQLEVCDVCRVDVTWNPGVLCLTPEIHRWVDPGAAPGEEPGELAEEDTTP